MFTSKVLSTFSYSFILTHLPSLFLSFLSYLLSFFLSFSLAENDFDDRVYYLSCAAESDLITWMKAIQQAGPAQVEQAVKEGELSKQGE